MESEDTGEILHNRKDIKSEGLFEESWLTEADAEILAIYNIYADKYLNYTLYQYDGKERVIKGIKRISKPGRRVYSSVEDMPRVLSGLGIAIVSTSKGIVTDKVARMENVGGEVLAFVW